MLRLARLRGMAGQRGWVKLEYAVPERPQQIHPVFWAFAAMMLVILGWSVVPKFDANGGGCARTTAARTDAATLQAALERFEADTDRLPTGGEGLGALSNPPA